MTTPGGTRFAVVTGGGTSGHVLPALAIVDALVAGRARPRSRCTTSGTARGVETRLLPPTGYAHTLLDVVGLQRSLSLRNLAVRAEADRAPRGSARGLLRELCDRRSSSTSAATRACRRRSRPGCAAVPVVVVSYDRRPGLVVAAERPVAPRPCAVAFEGSPLPRARLTGAPVRPEMHRRRPARDRRDARQQLGPARTTGSWSRCSADRWARRRINEAVAEPGRAAGRPSRPGRLPRRRASDLGGRRARSRRQPDGIMYRVIGYEDRMPLLYAAADLMVTQGGASTIAELATTGTPAIVVPWPGAAENHQLDNARDAHRPSARPC